MKVLGLAGSPRRRGNTDLLLEQAIMGADKAGASVETVVLNKLEISPCRHCDGCINTGVCVIKDDMQSLHDKLRTADRLILAAPLFFMTVPAQTKAMIDRCQALWVERYLLKIRRQFAPDGSRRKALLLCVGGMHRPNLFDPVNATVRAFFATCDFEYADALLYPATDEAGAIKSHPTALMDAFDAGVRLVKGHSSRHA